MTLTNVYENQTDATTASSGSSRLSRRRPVVAVAAESNSSNEQINGQIHYTPDAAQWGSADSDIWSLPIGERGSLNKQAGDCEDFVLAKYAALGESGVPDESLRVLLVHDNIVRQDHAVLAIFDEGKWLILDNRWNKLVEDKELWNFTPLFVVEKTGVHMLAKVIRINDFVTIAPPPARIPPIAAGARAIAHRP